MGDLVVYATWSARRMSVIALFTRMRWFGLSDSIVDLVDTLSGINSLRFECATARVSDATNIRAPVLTFDFLGVLSISPCAGRQALSKVLPVGIPPTPPPPPAVR